MNEEIPSDGCRSSLHVSAQVNGSVGSPLSDVLGD